MKRIATQSEIRTGHDARYRRPRARRPEFAHRKIADSHHVGSCDLRPQVTPVWVDLVLQGRRAEARALFERLLEHVALANTARNLTQATKPAKAKLKKVWLVGGSVFSAEEGRLPPRWPGSRRARLSSTRLSWPVPARICFSITFLSLAFLPEVEELLPWCDEILVGCRNGDEGIDGQLAFSCHSDRRAPSRGSSPS